MNEKSPQSSVEYWSPFVRRYANGEWRAPIFRDMIANDADSLQKIRGELTILDIGCGWGFDCNKELQESIAKFAHQYVGVEPDNEIELGKFFTEKHRCFFEDAPIKSNSIDIAFAVMVLEHFERPEKFWQKVHDVLREDGVFWGFTVDSRHWFAKASVLTERLGIKSWYLSKLHGNRGDDRYENYPVFYQCNTPKKIQDLTKDFKNSTILSFQQVGQLDFYLPKGMKWIGRAADRIAMSLGLPGSMIVVRVVK